jgi:hypothetical protein
MIDGMRYSQIMGHVWFKAWWRTECTMRMGSSPVGNP